MPGLLTIDPEPGKALSAHEECALLRDAVIRNPGSAVLRLRLAKLSNMTDRFEDTIALLTAPAVGPLESDELLALARALLARNEPGDTQAARDLAERAWKCATRDVDRSVALGEAAKAALRLGDGSSGVALLEEALRLDPGNSSACKRLATHRLRSGDPEAVLALVERLAAEGANNSRLLASRMLALARLGRIDEAQDLLGLSKFLHRQPLATPSGFADLESFNAALAAELTGHSGRRNGRYGTASHATLRIDAPATGAAPAARALLARIAEVAQRHVGRLGDRNHPWLASRPERALLESWCVITEADGFEDWHTHPQGWLSGVYYAEVPAAVSAGASDAGCLVLGLPEGLVGEEASRHFGRELVRPQEGLLVLFPSHGYHRTFPHRSSGRRICISFDVRPT